MPTATNALAHRLPTSILFAYGVFGMPLAMAALPSYVHVPKFYGDHLGVDLALLGGVLLALRLADGAIDPLLGVLSDRGGPREGTGGYFGIWALATKPNLALAAGIALPLLEALGYSPGGRDPAALSALAIVYALIPCVLKLGAGAALLWLRKSQ